MKYIGLGFLAMTLVLSSCGGRSDRVGLFIYREDDLFMRTLTAYIQSFGDDVMPLETFYSRNSQTIQNEQIESVLSGHPSLMIINPVDRLGAHAIVNRLKDSDVPVIFFNREPLREDITLWEKAWYVGARAEQSGLLQADLAMDLFGDDPSNLGGQDRNGDNRIQTVILKGEQGHQDAEARTATVQAAFKNNGYVMDVLAVEVANWNRSEAYEKMRELLETLDEPPELILSNNDAMALGAISYMRQNGFFQDADGDGKVGRGDADWIPVLGIDGVPDAVAQINAGYLYGTVLNDAEAMARAIVNLAVQLKDPDYRAPSAASDRYIWVDYQAFFAE